MVVPGEMMVHRPMLMVLLCCEDEGALLPPEALCEDDDLRRCRSPRRTTSDWMTVLPPSVMLAVPLMWARRETLLPES